MMNVLRRVVCALAVAHCIVLAGSAAAQPLRYVYPPPETENDHRLDYYWGLLRAALEVTRSSHGDFEMVAHKDPMNAARILVSLRDGDGLTVAMFNGSAEREKTLLPVRIPLDKGLTGYRLFLTQKETASRLDKVRTLDELKTFSVGQGEKWVDTEILRAAGFHLSTSTNYEGLFLMLAARRFDVFPRGVNEIAAELANYRGSNPDLVINKKVMLYYPQPRYFFFPRNAQGEMLASRVEAGLRQLIDTGEFEKRYRKFKAQTLTFIDLSGMRVFRLNNSALSPETPLSRDEFWDSLSAELR